tara:strand:+ start:2404 stop:2919 length:516 start_codon:yes stop_codon:yes gene_type:complete
MIIQDTEHCKLCDNKEFEMMKGNFCGLTMNKPNFKTKCQSIILKNNFEENIKDINIEYESILKTKKEVFGHIITYLVASIFIFVIAYLITIYLYDSGYVSTITLTLVALGFLPIGLAIGIFNNYNTKRRISARKKEKLDFISNLYNKPYQIKINHLKDSLGNIEHEVDIKY